MDRNARRRKQYAEMPEHEKADRLRRRRDANSAKKRRLSLPANGRETTSPLAEGEGSQHNAITSLGCVFPSGLSNMSIVDIMASRFPISRTRLVI